MSFRFNDKFGFTEEEMKELIEYYNLKYSVKEISVNLYTEFIKKV
ncbi:hypothetical protein [Clostridium coskatii]|nr:hypothetical protein [Clostridium coskatii]